MPRDSEEYEYYKILCGNYEAFGYDTLGHVSQLDSSEEHFKIAILEVCAVICHGLISPIVRDMKNDGAAHFENQSLKSALVKLENLRIAFVLPSEE